MLHQGHDALPHQLAMLLHQTQEITTHVGLDLNVDIASSQPLDRLHNLPEACGQHLPVLREGSVFGRGFYRFLGHQRPLLLRACSQGSLRGGR